MHKFFILVFFVFILTRCFSQSSILQGTVKDELTGSIISGAHVFIPGTSFQTYSDSLGIFIMPRMAKGNWTLQAKASGYDMFKQSIFIDSENSDLAIALSPKTALAPPPITFSEKKREKYETQFYQNFLGMEADPVPDLELLNPEALIFSSDEKEIMVSAEEAIFFRNSQTGYLITAYFEPFILGCVEMEIIADYAYFQLDPQSAEEATFLNKNRLDLYERSLEFQLLKLLSGETDGFDPNPNPQVFYGESDDEYSVSFNPFSVTFEDGTKGSVSSLKERLILKANGAPIRKDDVQFTGLIEPHSPVFYLPSDFEGEKLFEIQNLEKTAAGLQERVYIHSDRDFYWPNEEIFFKGFIKYGQASFIDELSKTLHVELWSIEKDTLVLNTVSKISSGLSIGSLASKKNLDPGNYILRAYTAWSTNYGPIGLFEKPIQILDWDDFPNAQDQTTESLGVSFFADKQVYQANEPVTLNLMISGSDGKPTDANLSVSILDLNQTQPGPRNKGITEALRIMSVEKDLESFLIEPEFGIGLKGNIYDINQQPVKGDVQLLINGFEDQRQLKVGKDGEYRLEDLNYEGEFEVAVKGIANGEFPKTIKTLEVRRYAEDIPLPDFEYSNPKLTGNQFFSEEEIYNDLEEGEIIMEEAVIEAQRKDEPSRAVYGAPDNVVDPSELQLNGDTRQFLFLLSSKVPGMRVGGNPLAVSFRGGEPLVMINGIPAGLAGTPVIDVLSRINVFAIDRVEVVRRLVNTLGDQGRNGIIAIYTKTGEDYQKAIEASLNTFQSFVFDGYQNLSELNQRIKEANESTDEFKPVLYWNPALIARKNNLSTQIQFTTNKESGPIWVEVRGITAEGEPVYGRFRFNDLKPTQAKRTPTQNLQ